MDKEQQAWERASAKDIEASLERGETTIFERFDEKWDGVCYMDNKNGWEVLANDDIKSFLRDELEALAKELISERTSERSVELKDIKSIFHNLGIEIEL
jgi:hypothetical protein